MDYGFATSVVIRSLRFRLLGHLIIIPSFILILFGSRQNKSESNVVMFIMITERYATFFVGALLPILVLVKLRTSKMKLPRQPWSYVRMSLS